MYRNSSQKGFTLLEIIIVIFILVTVSSITFSAYSAARSKNTQLMGIYTLESSLRLAQSRARANLSDSAWGVSIQSDRLIIFKGSSYAARDTTADVINQLPSGVTVSGGTEIVFNKLTGFPTSATSLTVIYSNNANKTITINSKGTVNF